jgi:peptide/nickel transport system permease protein
MNAARRRPTVLLGAVILLVLVLLAAFAPLVASYAPGQIRVAQRLRPPDQVHWFGTDEYGRDLFARVVYGGRLSLGIGALTVLLATSGGLVLGLAAGYARRVDAVVGRVIDAMMAFPDILLAIALVAVIRPATMANVVIALGVVYMPRVARIVRASTISLAGSTFVEAARATGAGHLRIVARHIGRNLVSPVTVQASFIFAYAILAEAGLSFLGLGASPETPSWGALVAGGQQFVDRADWIIMFPGLAIVLAVFALQMVGDGLRDALDPRLRKEL